MGGYKGTAILEVYEPADLRWCACGQAESAHAMDTVRQLPHLGMLSNSTCQGFKLVQDENPPEPRTLYAHGGEEEDRKMDRIAEADDSYTRERYP